jgi:hypothetical protein
MALQAPAGSRSISQTLDSIRSEPSRRDPRGASDQHQGLTSRGHRGSRPRRSGRGRQISAGAGAEVQRPLQPSSSVGSLLRRSSRLCCFPFSTTGSSETGRRMRRRPREQKNKSWPNQGYERRSKSISNQRPLRYHLLMARNRTTIN